MPYLEHDGVHLFYLVEGYGTAIVLLHSWTCDMHDWSFQIPMLVTRGFTSITMDIRGHGDVLALLEHLGIQEAIFVGHNSGAVIASALAATDRLHVRGLVLIEPAYYRSERERENLVEGLQAPESPERAASLFARALYTAETPAYLKAWHMRRARSTPAEAVSGLLKHTFGAGCLGLWENMKELGPDRAGPRLVICA